MKLRILTLATLLSVAPTPWAAADGETPGKPYQLSIVANMISLRVSDGSVVELVEDLGRRLGFEVLAQGVDDTRVTLDFDGLSPREAIRAICKPVGYVEVPDPTTGKIVRIVLPPGSGGRNRLAARREPLESRPTPPVEPTPATTPVPADKPPAPDKDDDPGA